MTRTALPFRIALRRRARTLALRFESLEDRSVPAATTFTNDNWNLVADNGAIHAWINNGGDAAH
jgi:hypothetical protein